MYTCASCTYDNTSQLCQTKHIKTIVLALIKKTHHTPTPSKVYSGHAGQSISKRLKTVLPALIKSTHHQLLYSAADLSGFEIVPVFLRLGSVAENFKSAAE